MDDNRIELNALFNVLVVGSVSFGAVFSVVEVDADIRTGWTWWEILRNIPADNLAAYQQSVFDNPVPTKACTSGVAYTLGDFTCQLSQGKTVATVDLRRSLRSGFAGFLIHGPLCHYWLLWTEQNLSFNDEWWTTPLKVFADQTAWSLFLNSAYTACIMSLQGMSPARVKGEIQATWWNAISAGWKFWPFVHVLTFSPVIPQDFKLLWVDCVEVIWVTILSAAVNRDSEKALQVPLNAEAERPGLQMQEQLANEFSAEVSGVEMRFDKDLLPSRDSMDGEDGSSGDEIDGCAWSDTCAADFGGRKRSARRATRRKPPRSAVKRALLRAISFEKRGYYLYGNTYCTPFASLFLVCEVCNTTRKTRNKKHAKHAREDTHRANTRRERGIVTLKRLRTRREALSFRGGLASPPRTRHHSLSR